MLSKWSRTKLKEAYLHQQSLGHEVVLYELGIGVRCLTCKKNIFRLPAKDLLKNDLWKELQRMGHYPTLEDLMELDSELGDFLEVERGLVTRSRFERIQ